MKLVNNRLNQIHDSISIEQALRNEVSRSEILSLVYRTFVAGQEFSHFNYVTSLKKVYIGYMEGVIDNICNINFDIDDNLTNPNHSYIHSYLDRYVCKSRVENNSCEINAEMYQVADTYGQAKFIADIAQGIPKDQSLVCITQNLALIDLLKVLGNIPYVGYKQSFNRNSLIIVSIIRAITTNSYADIQNLEWLIQEPVQHTVNRMHNRAFSLDLIREFCYAFNLILDLGDLTLYEGILAQDNNRHFLANAILNSFMDFDNTESNVFACSLSQAVGIKNKQVIVSDFNYGLSVPPLNPLTLNVIPNSSDLLHMSLESILRDIGVNNDLILLRPEFDNDQAKTVINKNIQLFNLSSNKFFDLKYNNEPEALPEIQPIHKTQALLPYMSVYDFNILQNDPFIFYIRNFYNLIPFRLRSDWECNLAVFSAMIEGIFINKALGYDLNVLKALESIPDRFYSKLKAQANIYSEINDIILEGRPIYQTQILDLDITKVYMTIAGVITPTRLYIYKKSANIYDTIPHVMYSGLAEDRDIFYIALNGPNIKLEPVAPEHKLGDYSVSNVWVSNPKRHKGLTRAYRSMFRYAYTCHGI